MPSGMLWMAMATAMATPRVMLSTAEVKVAMPSGKLWMPMARAVSRPMRMSFGLRGRWSISSTLWASCGFSTEGTSRSMMPMREDSCEETQDGDRAAEPRAPFGGEGDVGLLEELDERDVDHHAAGESEREGEQPFVGPLGQEGDGASDSGCETGSEVRSRGASISYFSMVDSRCGCLRTKIVYKTEDTNREKSVFFVREGGFRGGMSGR